MLTKHEIVLDSQGGDGLGADFWQDGNAGAMYVWLPRPVYRDMGEPRQITVTVVPGDALNEDHA